jgi:membrane-bound ClpP family serine protease
MGIWIAKDIILYPFVWRAYEWGNQKENNSMIGLSGVAKDRLDPSGYILVRGELWKATVVQDGSVDKGEKVIIKGIRGLTLLVE